MKLKASLNKSLFILLILLLALVSFLTGLSAVISFQSKNLLAKKIENAVIQSEKLSSFDKGMTFERALKTYSSNLSFAVFDLDCTPIHVTNLLINPSVCKNRDNIFVWREFITTSQKTLLLGFQDDTTFFTIWKDCSFEFECLGKITTTQ